MGHIFSYLIEYSLRLSWKWMEQPASTIKWKMLWLYPNMSNRFGNHLSGILSPYMMAPAMYTSPPPSHGHMLTSSVIYYCLKSGDRWPSIYHKGAPAERPKVMYMKARIGLNAGVLNIGWSDATKHRVDVVVTTIKKKFLIPKVSLHANA